MLIIQYRRKNAAYKTLVRKNLELINAGKNNNDKDYSGLKNGELFELLEQRMKDEKLFQIHDLDQGQLAELLRSNRTYLSQAISDHAGKNFRQYINDYRIREAMQLLANPGSSKKYSIDAIAKEVGFNSISVFNAAFKQITGVTPSFFREQAGNHQFYSPYYRKE